MVLGGLQEIAKILMIKLLTNTLSVLEKTGAIMSKSSADILNLTWPLSIEFFALRGFVSLFCSNDSDDNRK